MRKDKSFQGHRIVFLLHKSKVKGKVIPIQAVEALRVARG
jgi:hypothetical protein